MTLRSIIERILPVSRAMVDHLPPMLRERHHFESLGDCLWNLHQPLRVSVSMPFEIWIRSGTVV